MKRMPLVSVLLVMAIALCRGSVAFDAPLAYTYSIHTDHGIAFHWRTDTTTLHFAMSVANSVKPAWMGFGVGEAGPSSMAGADIMMAKINAADSAVTLEDTFTDDFTTPKIDADDLNGQWTLVGAAFNSTHSVVEAKRPLHATGSYDRAIVKDTRVPTKLLFAFGLSAGYHGSNRKLVTVDLFNGPDASEHARYKALKANPESLSMLITAGMGQPNGMYTIPAKKTTYYDTMCVNAPMSSGYITGFAPVWTSSSLPQLHHFVLKAFSEVGCKQQHRLGDIFGLASYMVPYVFPDDVGMDMSEMRSFFVEVHYDNPTLVSGLADNSGIEIIYQLKQRTHVAGMLQLADPAVLTPGNIAKGTSKYTYECPSSCTNNWKTDKINLFGGFLHMHQIGTKMETTVTSSTNTSDVRLLESSKFYSFANQATIPFPDVQINRGDKLTTSCYFKTDRSDVRFGPDSDQEMCIHFLYYYPKQQMTECGVYCGFFLFGSMSGSGPISGVERGFGTATSVVEVSEASTPVPTILPETPTSGSSPIAILAAFLAVLVVMIL